MGIYDNWTYTDLHQLNLDWILKELKKLQEQTSSLENFTIQQLLDMFANGLIIGSLKETYDSINESLTLSVEVITNE